MGPWLQVMPGAGEPIYAQIVGQIGRAIARGELSVGDKLPAVRNLASELVINPNTVARAYNILEQQGLVVSKTGAGTFVSDPKLRDRDAGQLNILTERMDNILAQGINIGLDTTDINKLFKERLAKFSGNKGC